MLGTKGIAKGVALCGLTSVFNLSSTAGYTVAPTLTPAANPGSLPAGCSISGATVRVPGGVTANFTGWDFTGYSVEVYGASPFATFSQCLFAASGVQYTLLRLANPDAPYNGGTTPRVDCTDCTFDMSGITLLFNAPIYLQGTSPIFNATRCKFTEAPRNHIVCVSTTTGLSATLTDCYFTRLGRKVGADAHCEIFQYNAGSVTFLRCFLDCRDKMVIAPAGWTGIIYPEADTAAITTTITDSILLGALIQGGNYTIQFNGAQNNTCTFTNTVMEAGSSGTLLITGGAVGRVTGTGCRYYDSGSAITIP